MRFSVTARWARRWWGSALAVGVVVSLAGCGGSNTTTGTPGSTAASRSGAGQPVAVLYAGSLVNLMEHNLGPKFDAATGYTFQGEGTGSSELANEIKGKTKRADVFISASPSADATLEGAANGNWLSWYATFATAPLVLGYNPHSRFAADLKSKPWPAVISEPGFRLGRTDPKLDPKGQLTVQALQQVGLGPMVDNASQVFPEQDLVGRLEAGQLDAGFFYSNEAVEQHIPTISLSPVDLSASYTVTVLNQPPDQAGAIAFVTYLLGDQGVTLLKQDGLTVLSPPKRSGPASAVPAQLHPTIG